MNPPGIGIEQSLMEHGPIAAAIAFVLMAVKAWKSEAATATLSRLKLGRIAWGQLNPAQRTGVSVVMTAVTAIAHVVLGASPMTAIMGALTTFAGAQATYTTGRQIAKTVKKEYTPAIGRDSSLTTSIDATGGDAEKKPK